MSGSDPKPITNRIRELRERSRLSQRELATLMGIDYTTISRHENGQRALNKDDIEKYSQIFKCSTWELFHAPDQVLDKE